MSDPVEKLRRSAKCVYIALESEVADDLSSVMKEAADQIEQMDKTYRIMVTRLDRIFDMTRFVECDVCDKVSHIAMGDKSE